MTESKENILIVDDNRDNLKVLVHILQAAGYSARPAHSASMAFSALEKKKPDLILLDILMPEISGYEACDRLKASPETADIPVIFISALGQVNDKVKAFAKGAVDYISKPFQEEEVLARVETHLKLRKLNLQLEEQNRLLKQEIAEREKVEETLRQSEEKYHSIFETNRAVKLIVDPESGGIVDANNAACEFYGYSKDRLTGMSIADIDTLWADGVRAELQGALEGKKRYFETRNTVSSGDERHVEIYAGPVRIGGRTLLYSIVHDVTERKILEAELEKARRFQAVGILAGGIAHDFNNLLTVISGGVELIKFYLPKEKAEDSIFKNVEESVRKASDLVRKFIDFSGRNASAQIAIDIRDVLEYVSAEKGPCGNHEVVLTMPDDVLKIFADRRQIHTAFSNLVRNACESMPDGGRIDIIVEKVARKDLPPEYAPPKNRDYFIKASVEDRGLGIPEENLERVFDPYFTTKKKNAEKGVGIGLTTAYAIVKRHEGIVRIQSRPNQGTTVTVYLPGI